MLASGLRLHLWEAIKRSEGTVSLHVCLLLGKMLSPKVGLDSHEGLKGQEQRGQCWPRGSVQAQSRREASWPRAFLSLP